MKKRSRKFSRVLSLLSWANFYAGYGKKESAHSFLARAYKFVEEIGGKDVKIFYDGAEYNISFRLFNFNRCEWNLYYTASASRGFRNDLHAENYAKFKNLIRAYEEIQDRRLRYEYRAYQDFLEFAKMSLNEYLYDNVYTVNAYERNGDVNDIPYDVAVALWNDFQSYLWKIVNAAVAYKKTIKKEVIK